MPAVTLDPQAAGELSDTLHRVTSPDDAFLFVFLSSRDGALKWADTLGETLAIQVVQELVERFKLSSADLLAIARPLIEAERSERDARRQADDARERARGPSTFGYDVEDDEIGTAVEP